MVNSIGNLSQYYNAYCVIGTFYGVRLNSNINQKGESKINKSSEVKPVDLTAQSDLEHRNPNKGSIFDERI